MCPRAMNILLMAKLFPPLSIRDEQIIDIKVGEYSPKCVEEMIDLTKIFGHYNRLVLTLLTLMIVTVRNLNESFFELIYIVIKFIQVG